MSGFRYQLMKGVADCRGDSFHIPQSVLAFLGNIKEMHFVTIEPGSVRGNHYHKGRKEFMFVNFDGPWSLAWSNTDDQELSTQEFDGRGGVIIEIPGEIVHAVKNTGVKRLYIVSCSDAPYAVADTERKVILE